MVIVCLGAQSRNIQLPANSSTVEEQAYSQVASSCDESHCAKSTLKAANTSQSEKGIDSEETHEANVSEHTSVDPLISHEDTTVSSDTILHVVSTEPSKLSVESNIDLVQSELSTSNACGGELSHDVSSSQAHHDTLTHPFSHDNQPSGDSAHPPERSTTDKPRPVQHYTIGQLKQLRYLPASNQYPEALSDEVSRNKPAPSHLLHSILQQQSRMQSNTPSAVYERQGVGTNGAQVFPSALSHKVKDPQ